MSSSWRYPQFKLVNKVVDEKLKLSTYPEAQTLRTILPQANNSLSKNLSTSTIFFAFQRNFFSGAILAIKKPASPVRKDPQSSLWIASKYETSRKALTRYPAFVQLLLIMRQFIFNVIDGVLQLGVGF